MAGPGPGATAGAVATAVSPASALATITTAAVPTTAAIATTPSIMENAVNTLAAFSIIDGIFVSAEASRGQARPRQVTTAATAQLSPESLS